MANWCSAPTILYHLAPVTRSYLVFIHSFAFHDADLTVLFHVAAATSVCWKRSWHHCHDVSTRHSRVFFMIRTHIATRNRSILGRVILVRTAGEHATRFVEVEPKEEGHGVPVDRRPVVDTM